MIAPFLAKTSRRPVIRTAILFGILVWTATIALIVHDREVTLELARENLRGLVSLLALQLDRTLDTSDYILQRVRARYLKNGPDTGLDAIVEYGPGGEKLFPEVGVLDRDGIYVQSNVRDLVGTNASGHEYFLVHKGGTVDHLFVSRPAVEPYGSGNVVHVTRRIESEEKAFRGVADVALDMHAFASSFAEATGKSGTYALVGLDGVIRMRLSGNVPEHGRNVADTDVFKENLSKSASGTVIYDSLFYNETRLIAYQRVGGYPMAVTFSEALDKVLAPHEGRRVYYLASAFVVTALLGLATALALTSLRQMQLASEHLVAARDADAAANRHKSEFLAHLSHELRTPLHGILGNADLLRSSPTVTARDDVESASAIFSGGEHLLALVDRLLDMSRIEEGSADRLDIWCVPLSDIVEEPLATHRREAGDKGLFLHYVRHADTKHYVYCDPTALKGVLHNLLNNAVKFTETGGVTLRVLPQGEYTRFEIIDTGIGIAQEDQEKVFDRFVQLDTGHMRRYGGAGLGLTLARTVVARMGGTLELQSAVGQGSTFAFSLLAAWSIDPLGKDPAPWLWPAT